MFCVLSLTDFFRFRWEKIRERRKKSKENMNRHENKTKHKTGEKGLKGVLPETQTFDF